MVSCQKMDHDIILGGEWKQAEKKRKNVTNNNCSGMVGELVRREADIAIAPLTINSQREQVFLFIINIIIITFIILIIIEIIILILTVIVEMSIVHNQKSEEAYSCHHQ